MNFGLIGYGKIAHKILHSISSTDGRLVAIASRSVKPEDFIIENNIKVYTDYESLLNDKDVEAVYITLPHKFHFKWIIEAIKAHKAVICEKPLVLNSDEVKEIMKAVKEYDGYCIEAMKTKLNKCYSSLKEDLKTLGKINSIDVRFCGDSLEYYPKTSYMFDPEQGGAIYDLGTYTIGFVLGLINEEISNLEVNKTIRYDIDAEDIIDITFAGSTKAHMEVSTIKNETRTGYIETELATIEIPNFNRPADYTIRYKDGNTVKKEFPFNGDDMSLQIQCLIDDVKNGLHDNELNTMEDTLKVTELIEKIKQI